MVVTAEGVFEPRRTRKRRARFHRNTYAHSQPFNLVMRGLALN